MGKEIQEPGELIFLRYAFPVIGYCSKTSVSANEMLEFERMLKSGGVPSRIRLEEIFPNAIQHLKDWAHESVRDYWLGKHNKIVGDNTLCRVYAGETLEILPPTNGEICRVRVKDIETLVQKSYITLKKGDLVSMHALQIAEKLSQKDFNKYFKK
jgi:hypothetical protein